MDDYQKYLNKALRFLSYRSRSEKEVRDFFNKKSFKTRYSVPPQEIIEKIIEFLKEKRFINDEEFARWWIDQSLRVRSKSKRVIEMELKQKGVDQDTITQAILNFKFSIFNDAQGGVNDLDTARKLVAKKLDKYKNLPKQEIYQKLGGFLARRGFDWETIKKSIDSAMCD